MEDLRCHCTMCVKNECKETFDRRSAKFTGSLVLLRKGTRREIAVDSDTVFT